MPKYKIKLSDGRTAIVTADHEPSIDEVMAAMGEGGSDAPAEPTDVNFAPGVEQQAASPAEPKGFLQTAKDVVTGAGKGFAHSVLDIGELAGKAGLPGLSNPGVGPTIDAMRQKSQYTNNAQKAGGVAETVAELALPAMAGVNSIPSAARAGSKFQAVMGAARNVPVDTSLPEQAAVRIGELADRGGVMPTPVQKFIDHLSSGKPFNYEVARDFASNLSRLSADEYNRLTPVVQKEVGALSRSLGSAIGDAADTVGMRPQYESAIKEYAQAKKLGVIKDNVVQGAKKALPFALGGGAAGLAHYWGSDLISKLIGD